MEFALDIGQKESITVDVTQRDKRDVKDVRFLSIGTDCGVHVVIID